MTNLSKNIRFLRDLLGVSQGDFGSLFECTRDNIMSYERGTEPKLKTIQQIANYFHTTIDVLYNDELNSHWTIRRDDKGNVYLICIPKSIPISKSEELGIQKGGKYDQEALDRIRLNILQEELPVYEHQRVILLNVEAAASISGALEGHYPEETRIISLPATFLPGRGVHYGFKVRNDSMHPTLYDGDWVIARHIEPQEWPEIRSERICVVSTRDDGVKIKRIRNRLSQSGFVRCRSDNKQFPAFNVEQNEIVAIFEVRVRISFNFPNEMGNLFELYGRLEDRMEDLENRYKS